MRDFNLWLNTFRESIATYSYYVDFNKIYENVDKIKVELNILNSLIGAPHIEKDFKALVTKYPEILKCIPILLAVRAKEIYILTAKKEYNFSFSEMNYSLDTYCDFMRESGLFELIEHHIIKDLVDYVTGVETGLDSNGRKNRGGHLMENVVETFLKESTTEYRKEMYISEVQEKWNVNLSAISNQGKAEKRFDFVVKTPSHIYLIETNFYTGGGSKLNETARSYKKIAEEVATIENVSFIWLTDGKGWVSARHNLQETFEIMEHLYNIADLENGILTKVLI